MIRNFSKISSKISGTLGVAALAGTLLATPVLANADQSSIEAQQAQPRVLLAQSMADRMRQAGDAVANSPMLQKAMDTVRAELMKCAQTAIADEAVVAGVMNGDFRTAAIGAMRTCLDRVEAGEFAK